VTKKQRSSFDKNRCGAAISSWHPLVASGEIVTLGVRPIRAEIIWTAAIRG